MTRITLNQLNAGDKATVIGFNSSAANFRRKLIAMGLMPGTEIKVKRFAPLGDPMQIQMRGCAISLRNQEAAIIEVTPIVD